VRECSTAGNGLVINTAGLFDEKLGRSAKLVAELLAEVHLSASRVLTVLVWDDAETIFLDRQKSMESHDPSDVAKVITTLLAGMDSFRRNNRIIQFATTNLAGLVDQGITSRTDYILTFAVPTYEERLAILTKTVAGLAGKTGLASLAAATEGWSGRDLNRINLLAFLAGSAKTPEELTHEDYLAAVRATPGTGMNGINHGKEKDGWTRSSPNGYPVAPTARENRLIWHW
jgi:AAA+ superfamily predicted ATPase